MDLLTDVSDVRVTSASAHGMRPDNILPSSTLARPSLRRTSTDPGDRLDSLVTVPRSTAPYSRSVQQQHRRSYSSASPTTRMSPSPPPTMTPPTLASAPPMLRTRSMPAVPSTTTFLSPVSAYTMSPSSLSPHRITREPLSQSPLTKSVANFASISEDAELDFSSSTASIPGTRPLSIRRQRPSSPKAGARVAMAHSPPFPSRAFAAANESHPSLRHYSSTSTLASLPSTPTSASARSRSPSISSLDTIEDAPDLEYQAIEADKLAKKTAAEAASQQKPEDASTASRRRSSLDFPGRRSGGEGGAVSNSNSNRKRWSVCGAERRADLDLETIWED